MVHLGFDAALDVTWIGIRGMKCNQLLPSFWTFVKEKGPPSAVLLQIGENDLSAEKGLEIIVALQSALEFIWDSFPGLTILWSDLLQRRKWRYARNPKRVNMMRKKINKIIGRVVRAHGGFQIQHPSISHRREELFRPDRVHLSRAGYAGHC